MTVWVVPFQALPIAPVLSVVTGATVSTLTMVLTLALLPTWSLPVSV